MLRTFSRSVSSLCKTNAFSPLVSAQQAAYSKKSDGPNDLWEVLYDPYTKFAPKDPFEPTWNPKKKITFTLCDEMIVRIKFQKLERLDIYAYNSGSKWRRALWGGGRSIYSKAAAGYVGIGVAHATNHYLLPPQVMRLVYNEEKQDFWYIGGGLCFAYNFGPVHINAFAAHSMDELDKDRIQKAMDEFQEQMKSRNAAVASLGQIGYDCMRVMQEGFEAIENNAF